MFGKKPRAAWFGVLAASAALLGCHGGGAGTAGATGTTVGAASSEPEPSSRPGPCRAGTTANVNPRFCYAVPPGMKQTVDPVKKKGRYQLIYKDAASGSVISFIVWDLEAFDATWKALQANAAGSKAVDVKAEEIDGGAKLITYTTPGTKGRSIASYLVRGAKHTLECEVDVDKHLPTDKLVEVCKQIHEP